jgi:lysophospholipase
MDPKRCALNFDNAGFLMGVSSNLFPAYRILSRAFFNLTVPLSKYTPKSINAIIPNPFLGLGTDDFLQKTDEDLELVDGGFGNGELFLQSYETSKVT